MDAVASGQRRTGTRRAAVGAALALVLGLGLAPVVSALTATPAAAAPGDSGSTFGVPARATSGDGAHRAGIGWLSWGTSGSVMNGASVTNWHEVGPAQRAEVTCRLSNLTSALDIYTPGSYSGDGLDALYGGLPFGLAVPNGTDVTFDVGCTAELVAYNGSGWTAAHVVNHRPVDLGGLVFADAESTGDAEYVQATANNGSSSSSPWRLIDRHNGACSNRENDIEADVTRATTSWTAKLMNTGAECGSGSGTPSAVLLADGTTSLKVRVKGGGISAIALGYVLGVDFGDAPASFGAAGGLVTPTWTGGQLSAGKTPVAGYERVCVLVIFCSNQAVTTSLAGVGAPAVSLGATSLANGTVPYTADATGDTPDEDAFTGLTVPAPSVYPGSTTRFTTTIRCRGTVTSRVAGWIDWNGDKSFQTNEQSAVANCTDTTAPGGNVSLTWTVPLGAVSGPTFLRLRVSTDATDVTSPVGTSVRGEVEDWAINVKVARLEVTKAANVSEVPGAGGVVSYTVTLRNAGDLAFTASQPAYLVDDVSEAIDDATLGTPVATPAPAAPTVLAVAGNRITWSGALAVGSSVTITYPMTMRAVPADRIMTNLARASAAPTAPSTAVTCDLGSADLATKTCARVKLWALGVDVAKKAYVPGTQAEILTGAELQPGTPVEWRYTVTNTGSAPLTNVRLSDAWAESRTTAAGTTTSSGAPLIACPGLPAGTAVVIPRLEPGVPASVTCTAQKAVVPHP